MPGTNLFRVQASDVTSPDDLALWTISDVDMADGAYASVVKGEGVSSIATGETLHGKAFHTYLTFPTGISGNAQVWIGGVYLNGIYIEANASNVYLKYCTTGKASNLATINPAFYNLDTLLDKKLEITLTTEFVNMNQDGTRTDVNIGFYINGVLYNNQYLLLSDVPVTSLMQQVSVYTGDSGGKSILLEAPKTVLSDMQKWTIDDVDMASGAYSYTNDTTGVSGTATGKTLDKKVFVSGVTLPAGLSANEQAELWIGEQNNGFALVVKGTTVYFKHASKDGIKNIATLLPSAFERETLLGERLEVNLSVECSNNNGTTTNANVGLYINGILYNGQYFKVKDIPVDSLKQQICVFTRWADGKKIGLDDHLTPLDEFEKWTITDVGLTNGTYNSNTTSTKKASSSTKKAFVANMTIPKFTSGQEFRLVLGPEYEHGVFFQIGPNGIDVGYQDKVYTSENGYKLLDLDANKVGLGSFFEEDFKITVTTELPDDTGLGEKEEGDDKTEDWVPVPPSWDEPEEDDSNTGDTSVDDTYKNVKIGIYFNDKFYGGFELEEVSKNAFDTQLYMQSLNGAAIWIGTPVTSEDSEEEKLNQWTIEDVGMLNGEYFYVDDTTGISGVATGATLDNTAFVAGVTLPGGLELANQAELWIGEQNNGFSITAKGSTVYFKHTSSAGSKYISTLDPKVAGLKTLLGEGFALKLTTEFLNNNGTTADVKVGLYINGVLYNNEYFNLTGVPVDSLKQQVSVFTRWAGGKKIILDASMNLFTRGNLASKTAITNNNEKGFLYTLADAVYSRDINLYSTSETAYKIYASDSMDTLFDEACELTYREGYASIALNRSVKYVAIINSQASNSQPKKMELSTVIFKGDMDRDGVVDSLDLADVRQLLVSYDSENYYEELADFNNDRAVDVLDLVRMKKHFAMVNAERKVPALTYEENVMPIVGYYGPTRVHDSKRNKDYDFITDDIYKKIQDMGINLISTSADNYGVEDQRQNILDSLALAEKYGIGLYVTDSRLLGAMSEKDIKACIDAYDDYASFKGIHVMDEPMTDADWCSQVDPNGKQPKLNSGKGEIATRINAISGLTGYVNLFPFREYIGEEDYAKYMEEYIEICRPEMLSFDYYPFDYSAVSNESYFINLSIARQKSLEYGIPFWTHIQAGRYWNDAQEDLDTRDINNPTESELLWNVNVSLAYGAKGVQYFPLVQPHWFAYATWNRYKYDRNGLIGADGNENKWYAYAQKANQQIAAVDEVLLNAESKQVLAVGTAAQTDTGLTMQPYGVLSSVQVGDSATGAVIGCFDYKGNDAFYVVNYDTDANNLTTTRTQKITLNFDGSQEYRIISEQLTSGAKSGVASSCTIELIAGGSALIVIE